MGHPVKENAECQPSLADEELTFEEGSDAASDYAWLNTSLSHMACKFPDDWCPPQGL